MSPGAEKNGDAVVLLSGGLDSATVLALATAQGYRCHALSVHYAQRHRAELNAASALARHYACASHTSIDIGLDQIGGSALTDPRIQVPETPQAGIPATYVPARNTIFLSLALGLAEVREARKIFVGVNAVDYSGYPDCRPEFITAFSTLANLATKRATEGQPVSVEAPLIKMTKAEIIRTGQRLGVPYAQTVSCYQADADGRACARCDSCRLRAEGFASAGVADPTPYQVIT